MTTRRLNYTGCQRIRRADVQVSIDRGSIPPQFTFLHSLDSYEFPLDAGVILEAQAHWTLMRFECGTIGKPRHAGPLSLSEFDSPDGIIFRLKVIGTGNAAGLILGEADRIRPADREGREEARSFLAVQPAALGQVVWRLSFAGPEPLLQINERIADWRSFMRRADTRALILPELYRQLLFNASTNPSDIEAEDAWQQAVLNTVPAAVGPRPTVDDEEALHLWVDDAVTSFAAKHQLLRVLIDLHLPQA